MPKLKSVVLPDAREHEILSDTVPQAHCKPKVLFVCKEGSNGCTTQWSVLWRFLSTLSANLDATGGRQLTMTPFTKQVGGWVAKEVGEWYKADVEASADGLRIMIRSLKSLKDDFKKMVLTSLQGLANDL